MNKIESFKVNHMDLYPGIYISRKDIVGGEPVVTYDLRMIHVNHEPAISPMAMHTIEHIGATFFRSDNDLKDDVIYFGGMFCCTGCYLILKGNHTIDEIKDKVLILMNIITSWNGDISGATKKECGNYLFHNLPEAQYAAYSYMHDLLTDFHCDYPVDDEK